MLDNPAQKVTNHHPPKQITVLYCIKAIQSSHNFYGTPCTSQNIFPTQTSFLFIVFKYNQ
jgi:hypothetical protein